MNSKCNLQHYLAMTKRLVGLTALLLVTGCALRTRGSDWTEPNLVPRPVSITRQNGVFRINGALRVAVSPLSGALIRGAAERFAQEISRDLRIDARLASAGDITLELRDGPANAEAYVLRSDDKGVRITASSDAGLFYGLQTLRQLLPLTASGTATVPALTIEDGPRFGYRGMHLDVGRHFMPLEFVKKYIDLMARYKLNTFHWHLTEDQGWRLQINRYPRLTEVGGCRKETVVRKNFNPFVGDSTPHCGFYTQEQAREIVAYARDRFITVIPEIEMPGHSVAALAAYPELACTTGPFDVAMRWGVFEDVYCPKEETFAFLENVLSEVMQIFPSTYIHIGGDEVPKKRWEESTVAREVMQREGLKDTHELQSYFIRRIEKFLNANGRRLIGWDEILEGGLAPNATVMSWRGIAGGIAAARQGHDVIMTPSSHLYFDHYQGDSKTEPFGIGGNSPLEKVYSFEPIPTELTTDEAKHILGAQANVWTEYMKTPDHVEYMVFPRLFALSELVWTPAARRDFADFRRRIPSELMRLDRLGVRYRPLD